MTWTCTKCQMENPELKAACLHCNGADRPAGLSEEERAALVIYNAAMAKRKSETVSADEFLSDALLRRDVTAIVVEARAPLEAELTKLRLDFAEAAVDA